MKNLYPASQLLQAACAAHVAEPYVSLSNAELTGQYLAECAHALDLMGYDGHRSIETKTLVPQKQEQAA